MMQLTAQTQIFLYRPAVDFRRAINGLAILVEEVLQQSSVTGHWFLFTNKRRDRVKVLYWDHNGYCLWLKRLEQETFHWPKHGDDVCHLSGQELQWLLQGYNLNVMKPHKTLNYQFV